MDLSSYAKFEDGIVSFDVKKAAMEMFKPQIESLKEDIASNKIELIPGISIDNVAAVAVLDLLLAKLV